MEKNGPENVSAEVTDKKSDLEECWTEVVQTTRQIPSARHLHSLVYHEAHLYLFGGLGDGDKYLDDFWQYSFAKKSWKKIKSKNAPSARHSHQAVIFKDKMIVFGGQAEDKTMNDLWSFHFGSKTWKQERTFELDKAVRGHSMVVFLGKIVIFGGANETNKSLSNNLIVLDASSFEDLDINVTHSIPARMHASMVSTNDAIYLFGGLSNTSLQDFYKMTINNNQIVIESLEVPSFMPCLHGASLVYHPFKSQLLLFGGQTNHQLNDITYSFSLRLSKWRVNETIGLLARVHHQSCTINEQVIMFGGLGLKKGKSTMKSLSDMWLYLDQFNQSDPEYFLPIEIWNAILSYLTQGSHIFSASLAHHQLLISANQDLAQRLKHYVDYSRVRTATIAQNTINLVVIGRHQSGKTALVVQFTENLFISEYDPTIEWNARKRFEIEGRELILNITDTAGEEEYNAHGVILVYSIANRESFTQLDRYLALAKQEKQGKKFPLIIVGNKCDLESERQVSQEEGRLYAENAGALWMETSAQSNMNHLVQQMFMRIVRWIIDASPRPAETQVNEDLPAVVAKKDKCLVM